MALEAPIKGLPNTSPERYRLPSLEVAKTFNATSDFLSVLWRNHVQRGVNPMLPFKLQTDTSSLYPMSLSLSQSLIKTVGDIEATQSRTIDTQELFNLALQDTSHTPRPEFAKDAINTHTVLFFRGGEAFTTAGIANYFVVNKDVQEALAHSIEESGQEDKPIRVKELSTGGRPRWKLVAEALKPETKLDVTLADFDMSVLPTEEELAALETPNITYKREADNGLNTLPVLPEDERYDVMLTTYSFDSVWYPQDARYTKIGGEWYVSSYRLKAPEGIEQEQELLEAMKNPSTSGKFSLSDLAGIAIEEIIEPIKPDDMPYFDAIAKRYEAFDIAQVNFPGGMLNKIDEAFETQIRDGGTFIIGDVATLDLPKDTDSIVGKPAYLESGGEKYKVEDYGLARDILMSRGYDVQLMSTSAYTGKEDEHDGQVVMIVRKQK